MCENDENIYSSVKFIICLVYLINVAFMHVLVKMRCFFTKCIKFLVQSLKYHIFKITNKIIKLIK